MNWKKISSQILPFKSLLTSFFVHLKNYWFYCMKMDDFYTLEMQYEIALFITKSKVKNKSKSSFSTIKSTYGLYVCYLKF